MACGFLPQRPGNRGENRKLSRYLGMLSSLPGKTNSSSIDGLVCGHARSCSILEVPKVIRATLPGMAHRYNSVKSSGIKHESRQFSMILS